MNPSWERLAGAEERRAWSEVLVPVARELEANAAAVSVAMIELVQARIPALFAGPEALEENRASSEAGVRTFAAIVLAGADPVTMLLPEATAEYAQASVRRGDSLAALIRSYRLAIEVMLDGLFDRLDAYAGDQRQLQVASRLVVAWAMDYMDAALTQGEAIYDAERVRWLRSAAASQTETIQALLDGRQRDSGEASMRLRYELERHHLGALVWLDGAGGGNPLEQLESAVGELAAATDAESVLVEPLGLLAAAAWLGRVRPFPALDGLRVTGAHAAIGEPAPGVAGFRATHAEARHARRVATLAERRPGPVTRFGAVALAAMATADVDQARAFVARELGPLAADEDVPRRLAATLRAYLDESASRSRAAKRLGIHENTVSYRVRQAEELLGRSAEERTLDLRVALALLSVLPAD